MKDPDMTTLKDLVTQALEESATDEELAQKLASTGALEQIVALGTYDEDTVQERLNYATRNALRAGISKARRNKGTFPIPVIDGKHWARNTVDEYRRKQQHSKADSSTASPA
jgi:hypothetical protein